MFNFRLSLIKIGPGSIGINLPSHIIKKYANLNKVYISFNENCEMKIFLRNPYFRTREVNLRHNGTQTGILIPKQIIDDIEFFYPNSHINPKDKITLTYNEVENNFVVKFDI